MLDSHTGHNMEYQQQLHAQMLEAQRHFQEMEQEAARRRRPAQVRAGGAPGAAREAAPRGDPELQQQQGQHAGHLRDDPGGAGSVDWNWSNCDDHHALETARATGLGEPVNH